jgi:LCP family protein required for cell wall assembly
VQPRPVQPSASAANPASTRTPPPSHTNSRSRLRRLIGIAALVFIVALVAVSWYVWGIVHAIDKAQDQAVVDWPTRVVVQQPTVSAGVAQPSGDQQQSSAPFGGATPGATQPAAAARQGGQNGQDPSAMDIAQGVFGAGTGADAPSPNQLWPNREAITILVVGIDRRPEGGDQNADTIILARLNLRTNELRTVSIPRDLYVNIPGVGMDKINSAYNHGLKDDPASKAAGVAKLRDTIEQDFGISIDDYILVDFNGFQKVVDALGGIDLNVPKAIYDPSYPTDNYGTKVVQFPVGEQHMNGEQALEYARTRHDDNDDARRSRQEQVLIALFEKGKQLGSLTHAKDLIVALGGTVQTSFHFNEQLALARLGFELDRSQIEMATVLPPMVQAATAPNGAWIYTGDMNEISAFIAQGLGITPTGTPVPATPTMNG